VTDGAVEGRPREGTMQRLDDLGSYRQLIRLLPADALRAHAGKVYARNGGDELGVIRAEFRRRRAAERETHAA
jgi:hypothetical protein